MSYRAALILILLTGTASAQTVYKFLDAGGNVIYTEAPLEDGRDMERVHIEPGPDSARQDAAKARQQQLLEAAEAINVKQASRASEERARRTELEEAEAAVAEAEQALAQARVKKRKDYRQPSVQHRLRKSYYDRVRFHEQQLFEARERLRITKNSTR